MFRRFMEAEGNTRLFAKGDIKYVILDLLKDHPSHGYEMIRALEDLFHGMYSPSAGSVYPTLQMLEEMEYVTSEERDGKKVYSVTARGREFLAENRSTVSKLHDNMRHWSGEMGRGEIRDILHDLRDLSRWIGRKSRKMDRHESELIRDIIAAARRDIERIFGE
jgi:DNA-binding PadR family transcriptional regulator